MTRYTYLAQVPPTDGSRFRRAYRHTLRSPTKWTPESASDGLSRPDEYLNMPWNRAVWNIYHMERINT